MSIKELYPTTHQYVTPVDNYVHHGFRSKNLTNAINQLLPDNQYTGNMVRAIALSKKRFNTPDIRLLMAPIQQYALKHKEDTYYAWSKIIGDHVHGMMKALQHQLDTTSMNRQGIILSQDSTGLCVNKVFHNDQYHNWFYTEHEVLAQMSNDVNIIGFWYNNMHFNINQFKEFVEIVNESE